jgi:hypothetical protein
MAPYDGQICKKFHNICINVWAICNIHLLWFKLNTITYVQKFIPNKKLFVKSKLELIFIP